MIVRASVDEIVGVVVDESVSDSVGDNIIYHNIIIWRMHYCAQLIIINMICFYVTYDILWSIIISTCGTYFTT